MNDLPVDERLDDVVRALADRVRSLRRRRGMSASDLSFESGLSEARVRGVEAGRTAPSLATLVALAETFEITLAELFSDASVDVGSDLEPDAAPSSPYVVPSAVVWGGDLPPAPWAKTVDGGASETEAPAPETIAGPHEFAATETVWGGPLPPAPWMPHTPVPTVGPPAPTAAQPVAPPTLPVGRAPDAHPAPTSAALPAEPGPEQPTPVVARVHDRARAHGMRENSAYVFVAPDAAAKAVPRTFSDLRTGTLSGRNFRSLQEFAVASVVEGGHALGDVARVFRIPAWRLEQWVIETGHAPQ